MATRSPLAFQFSLQRPPVIIQAGLAVHGQKARAKAGRVSVERFRHAPGTWAVHAHQYWAPLFMAGHELSIQPGAVTLVQPPLQMEFHFAGRSPHFYILFQLPPWEGARGVESATEIAALTDSGPIFGESNATLGRIAGLFAWQPQQASAELWSFLWRLSQNESSGSVPTAPDAVARARQLIEERLGEAFHIADLAAEAGLSHNQLTRQFRAQLGMTVAGYIAERRMERARLLLIHTTRPIKSIAAEVGMADLHSFNKCARRILGQSPRGIRRR